MRPTLRQLQYLVAVVETGRFGAAAKRMHISQPSLSTQIADMEAELGVQLLERTRTGVIATRHGEDVLRRARDILGQVEQLKASVRQGENGLTGQIRLGVLPSIGPYLLPSVTRELHTQYPGLLMSVSEARSAELETQLRDGRLDTLITSGEAPSDVSSLPLFQERLYICIAPDHELAAETGDVSLAALEGKALLSLGYGHALNSTIQGLANLAGARVSSEYVGTSLDAIRQMAAMGAGVAVLPSLYCISETQRDPDLIIRRISHPIALRSVSMCWRSTSPFEERNSLFAETVKAVAADLLAKL